MIFDKTQKNLIYVNSVYHDRQGAPSLIVLIQAIHIAKQIPAAPVFLISREGKAIQTAVLIAYALGIRYPQQMLYKNPNFEVFWKDSLYNMVHNNNLSDRCLAIAISERPVINEVAMGMGNRNGDMVAFKSSDWDGIFKGHCSKESAQQVDYQYMQKNFTKNLNGLKNDFEKALHFKTMYNFINFMKTKRPDILQHQIYSNLYDRSF